MASEDEPTVTFEEDEMPPLEESLDSSPIPEESTEQKNEPFIESLSKTLLEDEKIEELLKLDPKAKTEETSLGELYCLVIPGCDACSKAKAFFKLPQVAKLFDHVKFILISDLINFNVLKEFSEKATKHFFKEMQNISVPYYLKKKDNIFYNLNSSFINMMVQEFSNDKGKPAELKTYVEVLKKMIEEAND